MSPVTPESFSCSGCGEPLTKDSISGYDPLFCKGCIPKLTKLEIALLYISLGKLTNYDVRAYAKRILHGGDPLVLREPKRKQ